MHVEVEQRFLLGPLRLIHLPEPHDRAQRLGVEAVGLGLGVDFLDVIGERLLLFLQPFDALDDGAELILGETGGRGSGGAIGTLS